MKIETAKELEAIRAKNIEVKARLISALDVVNEISLGITGILYKEQPDSPKASVDKLARERAEKIFRDIDSPDASPKKSSDDIDSWLEEFGSTVKERTKRVIDEALADKSVKDPSPKSQKEDEDACPCPRCTLERMIEEGIKDGRYVRRGRAVVLNGPENIDELFEKLFESLGAAKEKTGK